MSDGYPERLERAMQEATARHFSIGTRETFEDRKNACRAYLAAVDAWRAKGGGINPSVGCVAPAEPQRTCEEILAELAVCIDRYDGKFSGWLRITNEARDAHRTEVAALKAQVAERDKRIERALLILSDYQLAPNTCAGLALRILEGREP